MDEREEAALKAELIARLGDLHTAVLQKLDGLSDYDLRRPLTATGSNLLGIVKHLASIEAGYFGDSFGRPWPNPLPWFAEGAAINDDMWATPQESAQAIRDFYAHAWAHAQETFAVTALTDRGTVPWWAPERRHPTLGTLLAHMSIETARHAGHLDILRELLDESAGRYAGDPSMPTPEEIDWVAYRAKVQAAAEEFLPA